MITIWKYFILVTKEVKLAIPKDAEILDIQMQNNGLCLWALVNTEKEKVTQTFKIYGTGHSIEEKEHFDYIGTFQIPDIKFVGHLFRKLGD